MIRVGIGGWIFEPWRGTFFPKGLPKTRELLHASRRRHDDRDQQHVLQHPEAGELPRWAEQTPDDFVFAVKASRFATNRRVLAEAGRSIRALRWQRHYGAEAQAGTDPLAICAHQEIRSGGFRGFPRIACRRSRTADNCATPSRFGTRAFARRNSSALARKFRAAIVIADSEKYPMIADVTGGLSSMPGCRRPSQNPTGYSAADIAKWAERAKIWSEGGDVEDLRSRRDGRAEEEARRVCLHDQRRQGARTRRRDGVPGASLLDGITAGLDDVQAPAPTAQSRAGSRQARRQKPRRRRKCC